MQNKLLEGEDLQRGQLVKVRLGNGPWTLALVVDKDESAECAGCGCEHKRFWSLHLVSCALKECLPKNAKRYRFFAEGDSRFLTVYNRRMCIHPVDGDVRVTEWLGWKAQEPSTVGPEYSVRIKEVSK
jgi:hypothetical protein